MNLSSARDLKEELMAKLSPPTEKVDVLVRGATGKVYRRMASIGDGPGGGLVESDFPAIAAQSISSVPSRQRSFALGISPTHRKQFRLAIRVQRQALYESSTLQEMMIRAHQEVDVRYIGRVDKRHPSKRPARKHSAGASGSSGRAQHVLTPPPWHRDRCRPLMIGCSIGHYEVTAGTLGCFVKEHGGGPTYVLSNNHVLANENSCSAGDLVLQPGRVDGGRTSEAMGCLTKWIPLKIASVNQTDVALAAVDTSVKFDARSLRGLVAGSGTLTGMAAPDAVEEMRVHKMGRTTGATHGRVTAFELDNVIVTYGIGNCRFDGQIEIEGEGGRAFSDGGDSGSLIVDDGAAGVALLFAGSEVGGTNGQGLTYAHPLDRPLANFQVELLY